MQRYFIELTKRQIEEAPAFSITGEEVHHIVNVMRMNEEIRLSLALKTASRQNVNFNLFPKIKCPAL